MLRDITRSLLAVAIAMVVLGGLYPLAVTGISQLTMGGRAGGSLVHSADGDVVGARLVAQSFADEHGSAKPIYFQPRPSQTGYAANGSGFLNQGPNQQELADLLAERRDAVLDLEGPYVDGLDAADLPVDAVTNSGSGIDPHVSVASAHLQAHRVAEERGIGLDDVQELIDEHTTGRALGIFGERGVNVLELNLALDREFPAS